MTKIVVWFRRQRNRAYIYRGLLATSPVVITYGLVSEEQAFVLLGAAAAWLGNVQATVYTTTKESADD